MGRYEVIDFVAVLFGSAMSGEPTLEAFFERLAPFAGPFMALFGRGRLPYRSTLSRFLAAMDSSCLKALRHLFEQDLFAHMEDPETKYRPSQLRHLFEQDLFAHGSPSGQLGSCMIEPDNGC